MTVPAIRCLRSTVRGSSASEGGPGHSSLRTGCGRPVRPGHQPAVAHPTPSPRALVQGRKRPSTRPKLRTSGRPGGRSYSALAVVGQCRERSARQPSLGQSLAPRWRPSTSRPWSSGGSHWREQSRPHVGSMNRCQTAPSPTFKGAQSWRWVDGRNTKLVAAMRWYTGRMRRVGRHRDRDPNHRSRARRGAPARSRWSGTDPSSRIAMLVRRQAQERVGARGRRRTGRGVLRHAAKVRAPARSSR